MVRNLTTPMGGMNCMYMCVCTLDSSVTLFTHKHKHTPSPTHTHTHTHTSCSVSHNNIVKLYEIYDDKTHLYLVIEL